MALAFPQRSTKWQTREHGRNVQSGKIGRNGSVTTMHIPAETAESAIQPAATCSKSGRIGNNFASRPLPACGAAQKRQEWQLAPAPCRAITRYRSRNRQDRQTLKHPPRQQQRSQSAPPIDIPTETAVSSSPPPPRKRQKWQRYLSRPRSGLQSEPPVPRHFSAGIAAHRENRQKRQDRRRAAPSPHEGKGVGG